MAYVKSTVKKVKKSAIAGPTLNESYLGTVYKAALVFGGFCGCLWRIFDRDGFRLAMTGNLPSMVWFLIIGEWLAFPHEMEMVN